jgi:signal peptidase I
MSDDPRSDAGSPWRDEPDASRRHDAPVSGDEPGRGPAGDAATGDPVGSERGGAPSGDADAGAPVGDGPVEPDRSDHVSDHASEGAAARDAGRPRSSKGSFWRELPVLLVIAFLLAFLLRTFVLQVFYIPSSSMEPTLQVDDRMVVEKITYLFREPERGEIVVFEGETLGETDPDANLAERAVRGFGQFVGLVPASARDFVKRVIGLPGDEVSLQDGQVFINGEPIDEPYARLDTSDFGPVTVPDDSLFFLGDNRANSSDSRRSLGFVPMDHVVGRSALILWPFDHGGLLTGVEYDVPEPAVQDEGEPADEGTQDEGADDEVDDAA